MKSSSRPWAQCNTPEARRRRRARVDADRMALAELLPPVYCGPPPLSLWQSIVVLRPDGSEAHRITLYVPTSGRCDQWAAEIDFERAASMLTATAAGRLVSSWIHKRPSVSMLSGMRLDAIDAARSMAQQGV